MEGISTRMISSELGVYISTPKYGENIDRTTRTIQMEYFIDSTRYKKNFKDIIEFSSIQKNIRIPKLVCTCRTQSNRRFLE